MYFTLTPLISGINAMIRINHDFDIKNGRIILKCIRDSFKIGRVFEGQREEESKMYNKKENCEETVINENNKNTKEGSCSHINVRLLHSF